MCAPHPARSVGPHTLVRACSTSTRKESHMRVPLRLVAFATGACCLLVPGAAWGAVTVGSDLGTSDDFLLGCPTAEPCTGVQVQLPGHQIQSPIDGVVVRWRVGDGVGPLAFRVVHDAGNGTLTGVG